MEVIFASNKLTASEYGISSWLILEPLSVSNIFRMCPGRLIYTSLVGVNKSPAKGR